MTCVESCPVASTLTFSLQKPAANKKAFALSGWLMTLLVLGIMFAVIGYAMYAGVWQSPVPEELYRRIIPHAPMIGHEIIKKRNISAHVLTLSYVTLV